MLPRAPASVNYAIRAICEVQVAARARKFASCETMSEGWSICGAQWSQPVANGGKRPRRTGGKALQTITFACWNLQREAHGKEGVDGSSPSEGSARAPQSEACLSGPTCASCSLTQVWSTLWSSQIQKASKVLGRPPWPGMQVVAASGERTLAHPSGLYPRPVRLGDRIRRWWSPARWRDEHPEDSDGEGYPLSGEQQGRKEYDLVPGGSGPVPGGAPSDRDLPFDY
jgi:hypothetical protein